jgi:hypothetical protein
VPATKPLKQDKNFNKSFSDVAFESLEMKKNRERQRFIDIYQRMCIAHPNNRSLCCTLISFVKQTIKMHFSRRQHGTQNNGTIHLFFTRPDSCFNLLISLIDLFRVSFLLRRDVIAPKGIINCDAHLFNHTRQKTIFLRLFHFILGS